MAILDVATKILAFFVAVIGFCKSIKYIRSGYRWLMSWTLIKRDELNRLKKIDAKYPKVEADLKRLEETCAPYLEQKRAELVKSVLPTELEVDTDFDPRAPTSKYLKSVVSQR